MDDVLFDFLDLRREQLDFFQIDEPCKRQQRLRWRGDWTPVGAKTERGDGSAPGEEKVWLPSSRKVKSLRKIPR